jgi:rare lipoprotein A
MLDAIRTPSSAPSIRGGLWLALLATPLLAACGGKHFRPVSDTPVKIGKPYTVRGIRYTPAEDPSYDAVGYASWYGSESGNQTALGERFRPKAITGAHTTLPLPSYVEVTALETGRTILLRVNDRGPFSRGRILDLSKGAAEQLGIRTQGYAAVRVRRVEPPEKDRARLRNGKQAPERRRASATELANLRERLALESAGQGRQAPAGLPSR